MPVAPTRIIQKAQKDNSVVNMHTLVCVRARVFPSAHLGRVRYSVPVASCQGELSRSYPEEDLLWCVVWPVSEWRVSEKKDT